MNAVLKIALEISNGATIYANRNEVVTNEWINEAPNSKLFNSLYFCKNGIEFRISNHELPNRNFMSAHNYISDEIAIERGVDKLYYKNNIEVIVKDSEIVLTKLNFNN
jgi:hypothetical protein